MRRTSRRSLVNRLSSGNRKVSWQDSTAVSQTARGVKRNPRCDKVLNGGLMKPLTYFKSKHWLGPTQPQWIWISYIFHIISRHGKIWTQQIDLASNVWLHSSVGRASHGYRGGHGFESRWSPVIFQASSFQLLKLDTLLRWSLFTTKGPQGLQTITEHKKINVRTHYVI